MRGLTFINCSTKCLTLFVVVRFSKFEILNRSNQKVRNSWSVYYYVWCSVHTEGRHRTVMNPTAFITCCVVTSLGWDKSIFWICTFHIIPIMSIPVYFSMSLCDFQYEFQYFEYKVCNIDKGIRVALKIDLSILHFGFDHTTKIG